MTIAEDDKQPLDDRLVLLHRAAARLLLLEAGEIDLAEAFDGLIDNMDWTFWRACRRADAKAAKAKRDPRLDRLRRLLDDSVSLETAWAELNHTPGHAAASTLEALAYSCRQGPRALEDPNNLRGLAELSKEQLRDLVDRVQQFRTDLEYEQTRAVQWTADAALTLIEKWNKYHERKTKT
jgi:hypothetical protein